MNSARRSRRCCTSGDGAKAGTGGMYNRRDRCKGTRGSGCTPKSYSTSAGGSPSSPVEAAGSEAAGNVMIAQGGGKIINIASVAGLGGAMPEVLDSIAYNTSKGGLINFTRDLAVKWGRHKINVNAIAPGWFPSKMSSTIVERWGDRLVRNIPLGRIGGGEDLKGAIVYLASRASDYITGQILAVDGGHTAL